MIKKSIFYLLILSVCMGLTACAEKPSQEEVPAASGHEESYTSTLPLAYQMAFLQRYTDKLYFAVQSENTNLTKFYLHELEEAAEGIAEQNLIDEGFPISELMENTLLPAIESAEATSPKPQTYSIIINACNSCHQATGHGFIKIKNPAQNMFGQDFSKD